MKNCGKEELIINFSLCSYDCLVIDCNFNTAVMTDVDFSFN